MCPLGHEDPASRNVEALGLDAARDYSPNGSFHVSGSAMDGRADNGADAEPGSRWLTHRQLAGIRGISTASAIKLALRHGWRKQKDNRGTVRCLVPPEWINSQGDRQAGTSADERADVGADKSSEISVLRGAYEAALEANKAQIDALGGQIEALKGEIAAKAALIEGLEAQRHGFFTAEARANRAEEAAAGERARADALRDQLEIAQEELRQASEASDQVRQRAREAEDGLEALRQADEVRKARGRWTRIMAAWRGE